MSLLSQIASAVATMRRDETEPPTVVLRSDARAAQVLAGLIVWFDGDDVPHSQVAVVIGDEFVGYLDSEWVIGQPESVMKGFGAGDYPILPGDPLWEETGLHCPTEGCTYHLWVVCFDPADHLRCKRDGALLVRDQN